MITRVVEWSTRRPWLVIVASLALAIAGWVGRRTLSRDVLPDLAEPQLVLVLDWMGHSAAEVANSATKMVTADLERIPGVVAVRGTSMADMAFVDLVFDARADLSAARRAIDERVPALRPKLPPNLRIQVGPIASSAGWVFQYALTDPTHGQNAASLRRLQDEVLRPALAAVPGVAEVASIGMAPPRLLVEAKPAELRERGIAFTDVVAACSTPAGEMGRAGVADLAARPIPVAGSPPSLVRDVALVRMADDMPSGVADLGGLHRPLGGIVVAARGANLAAVAENVKRTLDEVRPRLPRGTELTTVYDRGELILGVENSLVRALAEEIAAVVLVILVFLLDWRSALVPLTTLPLVLLLTCGAMRLLGVPATTMSLGGMGIALGMAVDADLVALEACHRRLEEGAASGGDRRRAIVAAAASFAPAIITSLLITALSFLPVFAFAGETGRLLSPLAATKTLVVAAAALVAVTLGPALRRLVLRGVVPEFRNPLTRSLVAIYRPLVHLALARPAVTLATALLAVCSCIPLLSRLGGEFLPRVDEGDLLFMPTTLPGAPPHEVAGELRRFDLAIARFPEVATVFGKAGRAETATDPAPLSMIETTVRLKPRSEWPKEHRERWYSTWAPPWLRRTLGVAWPEDTTPSTASLVEKLDQATRAPGWNGAWTGPARARLDMMSTGLRTPVGIRVVSPDPARLEELGTALRTLALGVAGTRSAVFESLRSETRLGFAADASALARERVDPALADATSALLLSGGQLGDLPRDRDRDRDPTRIAIAADSPLRGPADQLRGATVRSSDVARPPVPLGLVGRTTLVSQPAMLRTENGEHVAYVYIDLVAGADVVGYVERAKSEVSRALSTLRLGPEERIEWAGQYALLAAGERRLWWIVPLVLISMFGLLFLQFRSVTEALLVLVSVPFALVGSVWTLFLTGYPLSAPVWIGLFSVVGLAMQTGVVMVVYIDEAFHRRMREKRLSTREDIVAAHAEGTIRRLRPKIMTITTMGAGLLPLLWAEGAGAEIMRRVAAPMMGGLVTSAFLTLEVLPVLYTIWRHAQLRAAERRKVPLEVIVGKAPSWASHLAGVTTPTDPR